MQRTDYATLPRMCACRPSAYAILTHISFPQNEAANLAEFLSKRNGTPGSIEEPLVSSVSMIISALLFGERYDHEHPKRRYLVKVAIGFIRSTSFAPLVSFLPALQSLLIRIPCTKFWSLSQRLKKFSKFVRCVPTTFFLVHWHRMRSLITSWLCGYYRVADNKK